MKEKTKNFRKRLTNALEMPEEVVLKTVKTTVMGTESITIENYGGILEYESDLIKIKTKDGIITVTGKEMTIGTVTDADIYISGKINSVRWE